MSIGINDNWIRLASAKLSPDWYVRLSEAVESGKIGTYGEALDRLERTIASLFGYGDVVAVSSATAALQLAVRCAGLGDGDEIWASSFTFIGSIGGAFHEGCQVRFIDCSNNSWNTEPEIVEEELRSRDRSGEKLPRALIVTDAYGQPCAAAKFRELCDEFGMKLIIDGAESLGSRYDGRAAGYGAHFVAISFNSNKIITGGGGGVLVCEDECDAARIRYLSSQAKEPLPYYEHKEVGYNYRMGNLTAALVLSDLEDLEERVRKKRSIFSSYSRLLSLVQGIECMPEPNLCLSNRWLTAVTIDRSRASVSRDKICEYLWDNNVEVRPVWKPMHLQPAFQDSNNDVIGGRECEKIWRSGLCLPSGVGLKQFEIERVVELVTRLVD